MKRIEKEKLLIQILEQNKGMLLTICKAYSKDEDELNDYFQEIVIRIWLGLDSYKEKSQMGTWIYRVALNTCITYSRTKSHNIKLEPLICNIDLVEDIEETKNSTKLYELINCLNRYEKALILLWLENLPYSEIAEIMGLSVKNVSVKLFRIKDKLKKMSNTK